MVLVLQQWLQQGWKTSLFFFSASVRNCRQLTGGVRELFVELSLASVMAAAFNLSSATAKFSHTSDRGAVLGHGIRNCTVSVISMDSSTVWPCKKTLHTYTHTHGPPL